MINLETLSDRRAALCLSFAGKSFKSEKFNSWFADDENNESDIQLLDVKTRTKRYRKSPLPYLTNLLNEKFRT